METTSTTLSALRVLALLPLLSCVKSDTCQEYAIDLDGDGYTNGTTLSCEEPEGAVAEASEQADCDDGDAGVHPGVDLDGIESQGEAACDQVDNDCDGETDEDQPQGTWYVDTDEDGWGDEASAVELGACSGADGYVSEGGDCDDVNGEVHPEAHEVCGDGQDQDCDEVDACALGEDVVAGAVVDGGGAVRWAGASAAAALGDVDGDELTDLALGKASDGRVWVVYGPATEVAGQELGTGDGGLGAALAAGDFDGDGALDLAVGAPEAEGGAGRLVLYLGLDAAGAHEIADSGPEIGLGASLVAWAGEEGDGLAVTFYVEDSFGVIEYYAYLLDSPASIESVGDMPRLGDFAVTSPWPLALAADADGRRLSLGFSGVTGTGSGAVVYALPHTDGSGSTAAYVPADGSADDLLGAAVALADLDGNRTPELFVGAPASGGGRGALYGFVDADGSLDAPDLSWTGPASGAVGAGVAVVGDINGDGDPELAIGGYGQLWLVFQEEGAYADGALASVRSAHVTGLAGAVRALADAGDVNGDGYDELLVSDEADTYLFWGGPPPTD